MVEVNYQPSIDTLIENPKFLKALFLVIVDEFNRLRARAGMPQITSDMVVTQIKEKMKSLG